MKRGRYECLVEKTGGEMRLQKIFVDILGIKFGSRWQAYPGSFIDNVAKHVKSLRLSM